MVDRPSRSHRRRLAQLAALVASLGG